MAAVSYLNIAKKQALNSNENFRLGACCVKSGRILGAGFNQLGKMNKLVRQYFGHPTLHAEISALLYMNPLDIKGSIIYVYRIGKLGEPRLAKPCHRCTIALRAFGVKKVIYSTTDHPYFDVLELRH